MNTQETKIPGGANRRKVTDFEEYFNGQFDAQPVYVPMLEGKCSADKNVMLITTAGAGLAVCISSPEARAGGLAHLIVPYALHNGFPESMTGDFKKRFDGVLESIMASLMQAGGKPEEMRAKLFGCGLIRGEQTSDIAFKLHKYVREYLEQQKIEVTVEEVGGMAGRRIHFFPHDGKAVRRLMKRQMDRDVMIEREDEFNKAL